MPTDLASLSTFVAVAKERSFTRAAKRQGVSPSAVSHSIHALEESLKTRLVARTTRSVALTDAGEQLLGRLRPALKEVEESLQVLASSSGNATGVVRLLLPRLATSVILPKLGLVARTFPHIMLDITTDDSRLMPASSSTIPADDSR